MAKSTEYNIEVNADIEFKDEYLSKELLDNYEKYFHEVSDDSDFDNLDSQIEKHKANIMCALLRGQTTFIEGYGEVNNFIKSYDIRLADIKKY